MRLSHHLSLGLIVLAALLLAGCTSSFEKYFVPASRDRVYHEVPREQVEVIQTGDQSPDGVTEQLFPEASVVGRSTFVAGPQSERDAAKFAGEIGANVVVWASRWLETHVAQYTRTYPETHTETVSFTDEKGSTHTREIEIETSRTELHSQVIDRYQHDALFLRAAGRVRVLPSE